MKQLLFSLLIALALALSAQAQLQLQSGIRSTITYDTNGNPQISAVDLFQDQGSILNYLWDWGDSLGSFNIATQNPDGSGGWVSQPLKSPVPLTPGKWYTANIQVQYMAPAAPLPSISLPGYKLIFDDEFRESDISKYDEWWLGGNGKTWICHQPSGGNDLGDGWDGIWLFPAWSFNNISMVPNFGVALSEWYETTGNENHLVSALICSKDNGYNGFSSAGPGVYWECQAWIPPLLNGEPANAPGLWSSFWLVGDNAFSSNPGPVAEIDIFEAYSIDYTVIHSTYHDWNGSGGGAIGVTGTLDYSKGWHTYGCLINADFVHFYIDGVETGKVATSASALQPLHCLFDIAFGGGFSTSTLNTSRPHTMLVKYIRCYHL